MNHTITSIPPNSNPTVILIQQEPNGQISYVAFHVDAPTAVDVLRRVLIHMAGQLHGMATVPAHAAIFANGNSPQPDAENIPPLRAPKTKPATRGKPGPKPGARRRNIDNIDADAISDF